MSNETSALEVLTISFCALHAGSFLSPFCMYVGISLLYASVAGALVSFVEPLAAGSGIAEVKTYLNGIHIRGLLAVGAPLTTYCRCIHKTCSLILLAASTGGKGSCRLAQRPIQERMPGGFNKCTSAPSYSLFWIAGHSGFLQRACILQCTRMDPS